KEGRDRPDLKHRLGPVSLHRDLGEHRPPALDKRDHQFEPLLPGNAWRRQSRGSGPQQSELADELLAQVDSGPPECFKLI
ncbi:MAG UNVERIFIED_CONTAM: hypothetical protein LOD86_04825, partial [Thermobifida fusca]